MTATIYDRRRHRTPQIESRESLIGKTIMNKLPVASIITVFVGLTTACQPQTQDPPPTETPDEQQETTDTSDRIDKNEQKVNDSNDLNTSECPPPRDSGEMCAQVIVWALSPEGQCCQYPTPCHAPKDWETFSSEEECIDAADNRAPAE